MWTKGGWWGWGCGEAAPATRHKMESQLDAHRSLSEEAGGGEDASGSIRPTSQLHLQL